MLEDRYRTLLRAYPRSYRERRGDEMMATLLETAGPGRRRPSRRDLTDLLGGAVRERLGLHAVPAFAAALRLVGPVMVALAAGYAVSPLLVGDRDPGQVAVAAVWFAAVLVRAVLPRPVGTVALILAWIGTVAAAAPIVDHWPTLYPGLGGGEVSVSGYYAEAVFLGAVAVLALATPRPPVAVDRLWVPAGTALVALGAAWSPMSDYPPFGPPFTRLLLVWPVLAAVYGVVVMLRRHDSRWLWVALLLLIPGSVAGASLVTVNYWYPPLAPLMVLSADQGVLMLIVMAVTAVAVWLAARSAMTRAAEGGGSTTGRRTALARGASAAVGVAGGSAAYLMAVLLIQGTDPPYGIMAPARGPLAPVSGILVMTEALPSLGAAVLALGGVVVAALVFAFTPLWIGRLACTVAAAGLVVAVYSGHLPDYSAGAVVALVLLLVVGAVAGQRGRPARPALVIAAVALSAVMLLTVYGRPISLQADLLVLWATTVMLGPLLVCAAGVVLDRGADKVPAVATFVAGALWLALVVGPTRSVTLLGAPAALIAGLLVTWYARTRTMVGGRV